MRSPRWVLLLLLLLLIVHQNYWLWSDDSLVLGLPVNLLYHVLLCLLASAVMFIVLKRAWPQG